MLYNRNDLDFQQGATFQLKLNVQNANNWPVDLTTYSAVMQIRPSYESNTILESLSTSNGEIVVVNTYFFQLTLPVSRTANVSTKNAVGFPPKVTYVYDMSLTSNTGVTTKIMYGQVNFYSQVTR